jgi:hypothetical protein
MNDKWNFWMEDGELLCASSMCDADGGCPDRHNCAQLPEFVQETLLMEWRVKELREGKTA